MDHRVKCWGHDNGKSSPPEDLGPVLAISAGDAHTCAITMDQRVKCWGDSRFGKSTPPEGLKVYIPEDEEKEEL